jgi:hypothetical protein
MIRSIYFFEKFKNFLIFLISFSYEAETFYVVVLHNKKFPLQYKKLSVQCKKFLIQHKKFSVQYKKFLIQYEKFLIRYKKLSMIYKKNLIHGVNFLKMEIETHRCQIKN